MALYYDREDGDQDRKWGNNKEAELERRENASPEGMMGSRYNSIERDAKRYSETFYLSSKEIGLLRKILKQHTNE